MKNSSAHAGEWGGFFKEGDLERTWAEAIVDYMKKIGATDQFFWCLNPNSGMAKLHCSKRGKTIQKGDSNLPL